MAAHRSNVDRIIARLSSRAHGIVTRRELLAAGASRHQIQARMGSGALAVEHPGVYRVGPRTTEARYMAAVKAGGKAARLSGLAAAHHLGLVGRPPPVIEISTATYRRVKGLKVRRRTGVRGATWRGIPCTTPAQTLVDVAPLLGDHDLALACHKAGVKHRTTPRQVKAIVARRPNAPGAAKLRGVMEGDIHISLSAMEREFLRILRTAGLPLPVTNRYEDGHYVDCRWPGRKLTVELDSYRFHNSRHAFEQDRRREREAYARGDDFRRYTSGDVFDDPRAMLRELEALLRA